MLPKRYAPENKALSNIVSKNEEVNIVKWLFWNGENWIREAVGRFC